MIYVANYALAAKVAVEVLEDYEILQAPISLDLIFKGLDRELQVKTYIEFMHESGYPLDKVKALFDSELGACCYDPQTGRYVIYYNSATSEGFIRFTLAHELGHIFLEHHIKAGTNLLSRSFISDAQYEEYEKEANVFARNLLSPAPLAWEVIEQGHSKNQSHDIEFAFNVTNLAAGVRVNMIRRDLRDYTQDMHKVVNGIKIRYQRHCSKCHHFLPKGSSYCMMCGSNQTTKSLWPIDLPKGVATNSKGFFVQCPTCGNADIENRANFCKICSTPLMNPCNGMSESGRTHKRHRNQSFSLFCEFCGAHTYYNDRNIEIRQEDTKMFYNDGVAYDDNSLRVKICPVCKNEGFRENAEFCIICGTNLYNECEGTPSEGYNGEIYYDNIHRNPSNARFCEICGKPTHFSKRGILVDYKTFQANLEAAELFAQGPAPELPTDFNNEYDPFSEIFTDPEPVSDPDDEPPFWPGDADLPFN